MLGTARSAWLSQLVRRALQPPHRRFFALAAVTRSGPLRAAAVSKAGGATAVKVGKIGAASRRAGVLRTSHR